MSNTTIINFFFNVFLVFLGTYAIANEKKLIQIERKIFNKIRKAVKK
jgi:hypothetical protein